MNTHCDPPEFADFVGIRWDLKHWNDSRTGVDGMPRFWMVDNIMMLYILLGSASIMKLKQGSLFFQVHCQLSDYIPSFIHCPWGLALENSGLSKLND
jgi:hypothetical protein